jgi:hypothetical protein
MAMADEEVQYLRRKRELGQPQTVYVGELEGVCLLLSAAKSSYLKDASDGEGGITGAKREEK